MLFDGYASSAASVDGGGGYVAPTFETPWSGVGIGGAPALDFVNTVDWRLREAPVELLHSFADLLRWARTAGIVEPEEAASLRAWGEAHPRMAARALAEAIDLREAIAAVLQAVARGEDLPAGPLERLDVACREAWRARRLCADGRAAAWHWGDGPPMADQPAWGAALDAARILTSDAREQVRECGDDQCGWLFLDVSRNRSRRWCTMQGCGNRNKVRRFYRRTAAVRKRAGTE